MANQIDETAVFAEDDPAILPDGWGENDDIFDVDAWSGESAADAQKDEDEAKDVDDAFTSETDESPTTADESSDDSEADQPTTQDGERKLKFSATVDHETKDVELDESELPTIYQKAQATDRAQAKLSRMQPVFDQVTRTAKMLGYDSVEEMLKAAEDGYRDGEVERLVNEGTQKDVAEDYVRRKMNDAAREEKSAEDKPAEESRPDGRDFHAEVQTLLDLRPDLKKPGTKLPDEVTRECISSGKPLAVVYLEYEAKQNKAKYDALLKENKKLKQNAEAASRAPVRGVSRGGATDTKANDDPFLAGFDADE